MSAQQQHPERASPRRRIPPFVVWLARIAVVLAVLVLAGMLYESAAEAADRRAYPPPGQMVDVGGYSLHINCVGQGVPTVVIESGMGDWSASWSSWVQPEVARTTRVCTYDRAGMGWSEPSPMPRTAATFVQELHTLLDRAGVQRPVVLAGHSLGGLTVRLFAHDYPAEVAGAVLIDAMHPDQATHAAPEPSGEPSATASGDSILTLAARVGLVRLLGGPLLRDGLSPEVADAYAAFASTPAAFRAADAEGAGLPSSLGQAADVESLDDLPLIVLSRGLDPDDKWQTMQTDLLQLSSNSQQLFAPNSGHNVQLDQPEAAVGAIVQMVDDIRERGLR